MAAGLTRLRVALLGLSVGLLLVVGASRPNAARPDLAPRGWAPGSLLPFTLDPAAVSAVLVVAYLLGAAAVWLGLRQRPGPLRSWWGPGALGAAVLVTAPFGSADHVNYLAYGRILLQGGDPWLASPSTWAGGTDPVVSRVEAPWTEEPSVYGPAGTLLHGLSAWVGGDVLRQGVWVWQVLVVLAWLAVRALLRATLAEDALGRVDVVWTLNPLVLGVGVLGAHIDVVAAALAVAAVAVAARLPGPGGALLGGAVAGLALSTKITYGIVLVALLGATWWVGRPATAGDRAPLPWARWGAVVGGVALGRACRGRGGAWLWAAPPSPRCRCTGGPAPTSSTSWDGPGRRSRSRPRGGSCSTRSARSSAVRPRARSSASGRPCWPWSSPSSCSGSRPRPAAHRARPTPPANGSARPPCG